MPSKKELQEQIEEILVAYKIGKITLEQASFVIFVFMKNLEGFKKK